jgi:hypothetical protein
MSEEDRASNDQWRIVLGQMFPAGAEDLDRDCARIDSITKGKIPSEKLASFVAACKFDVHFSEQCYEDRYIPNFMASAVQIGGEISESEAYDIYVYLEGEARFYNSKYVANKAKDNTLDASGHSKVDMTPQIYAAGTRSDEIPGGYGEYGLCETNPVPTVSVRCSDHYLSRLRYNGQPVQANRVGSTLASVTLGAIDIYELSSDGQEIGRVYLCPYHKLTSRQAPKGFTLA